MLLTDGKIPIDNNYAEQAIRPFTIARKNFLLMESDNGAKASTMIFSTEKTAKANNLNIYEYFELLLTELPKHLDDKNIGFINNLLPWSKSAQQKCPSRFKNLNPLIKVQIYEIAYIIAVSFLFGTHE